jgi:small subunit ribosomal protein S9
MAVTMAEITKLRHLTSAGLMDCKKALAETNGDIEAAVEILRKKGQAEALRLGIARALVKVNAEDKAILRKQGFMTRDPRSVERKKPGQPKARKRFQFSKR